MFVVFSVQGTQSILTKTMTKQTKIQGKQKKRPEKARIQYGYSEWYSFYTFSTKCRWWLMGDYVQLRITAQWINMWLFTWSRLYQKYDCMNVQDISFRNLPQGGLQ